MVVLPLTTAVEKQASKGAEDALARSFFFDPRVKKIIGSALLSSGLPFDFRDDLFQETWSIFHKYATTGGINDPSGVYSLVYATAYNSARTIRHRESKNGANLVTGVDPDDDGRERDIVDEGSLQDFGEAVDTNRARLKIASIIKGKKSDPMRSHVLISNSAPEVAVVSAERAKKATQRKLSPEQQELTNIITGLGYKHEDFAVDIGIGLSRLASYLYGRTTSVPDEIMKRARKLKEEAVPLVERWKEAYEKPMSEIIAGWEKALELTPGAKGNDDILAGVLDVNPVTIYRWRKGDTEPKLHAIAKMDGRIRNELDRRARRDQGVLGAARQKPAKTGRAAGRAAAATKPAKTPVKATRASRRVTTPTKPAKE